jgi:hypothetical protein
LAAFAACVSQHGPVAYLETDYFGGEGDQASIVWAAGQVVLGPLHTSRRWLNEELVGPPPGQRAINQALRRLGVERGAAYDEFEALELGRLRSTDDWARGHEAWRRDG